jgi:hypothetical protein
MMHPTYIMPEERDIRPVAYLEKDLKGCQVIPHGITMEALLVKDRTDVVKLFCLTTPITDLPVQFEGLIKLWGCLGIPAKVRIGDSGVGQSLGHSQDIIGPSPQVYRFLMIGERITKTPEVAMDDPEPTESSGLTSQIIKRTVGGECVACVPKCRVIISGPQAHEAEIEGGTGNSGEVIYITAGFQCQGMRGECVGPVAVCLQELPDGVGKVRALPLPLMPGSKRRDPENVAPLPFEPLLCRIWCLGSRSPIGTQATWLSNLFLGPVKHSISMIDVT